MSNIPPELIFDILLQLQLKDLIRYTCVSKAWHAFIHNQDFIKAHLKRSIKTNSTRTILLEAPPSYLFSLPFDNDETLGTATIIGCLIQSKGPVKYTTGIVGYANGLVCIQIHNYIDGDIALWNPSIQKLKKIPLITHEPHAQPSPKYGFGYDSTNDDYKLVGIIRKPANEYGYVTILTLDLASEKYREFSIPVDRIDNIERSGPDLDVLGDHMCIRVNRFMCRSEAWIMKEYGGTESWSLLYSIDMGPVSKPRKYQSFKPLVFSKNGEVFLLKKDCKGCSLVWKLDHGGEDVTVSYEVSVHCLKANSWKRIQNVPYCGSSLYLNDNVVLNGALSWLMSKQLDNEYQNKILIIDPASEKYHEFPIPVDLDFMEGHLCISVYNFIKSRREAWVMKEYGVTEFWSLLYSIDELGLGAYRSKPWAGSFEGGLRRF
ncbi:F-box/kelch-repeat protein At3g23880-like [Prunus dulcis]|uniref:F-box/kelch-repeat protein At3g23880-like n=1 Tax=Prunus dulcis TaxID=3755 RepID=UPI0014820BF4|nr:F-box/kelch-repeat protein At3g23880-like [Prunus dulcis]